MTVSTESESANLNSHETIWTLPGWVLGMVYTNPIPLFSGSGAMIAGIVFLVGLLLVVFLIANDRRRVFWRDPRRKDSRGSHLPIRFFWW